jgi:ABC-type phosphate transport system permease subunit
MMRVEFGTARHVTPPSVDVEREVVVAASSLVMGRVGAVVIVDVIDGVVIEKFEVITTNPLVGLVAEAVMKLPVILYDPPPPPEFQLEPE